MQSEDLSFFKEDVFKKKLALYEEMLRGGRSVYLEADELTHIAEYYLIHNNTDKALACIDYALSIHPGSTDPLIFLARQKMFEGDIQGAKKIRDCISDPNDREVIFLNAELMLREGKKQEAENYLIQKARKEEEDAAMFAYDTATLFLDYNFQKEAERWGEQALKLEPKNEKFLNFKADCLISAKHPEEAIDILNSLLDNDPYNINAWHSLGEAYFLCEDFPKTLETADFALAIDEHDAQSLLLKANCHLQQQNYDEAHHLYECYFKEHTANEIPYLFDGICLSALGRHREALTQLLKAEELSQGYSPEQQHIYANLSNVYSKMYNTDKAFEYIDKIKDINPDYDSELYKGHVLMQNNDKEEAWKYYDSYIQASENKADAHFLVGMSLMENKAYGKAQEHFLQVLDIDISKEGCYWNANAGLSFCALMQGHFDEFMSYLKTACEQASETLEYTVGRYIPEEVEVKNFYDYVLTHSDAFMRFNPDAPLQSE